MLRRVELDRGDSLPDVLSTRVVLTHLSDWTIWIFGKLNTLHVECNTIYWCNPLGVMFACATIPAYALSSVFFLNYQPHDCLSHILSEGILLLLFFRVWVMT